MLIALCTLLAAAPVSASLLPQTSAVHLLDTAAVDFPDDQASGRSQQSSGAPRLTAEAISGALGGLGLGAAGLFSGYLTVPRGSGMGLQNVVAGAFLGLVGLELGQILGITTAGSMFGVSINFWHVVLGNVAALAALWLLSPVVGPLLGLLAVAAGPVAGPILAAGAVGAATLAGGVIMPELLGDSRPGRAPSAPAVTLRF